MRSGAESTGRSRQALHPSPRRMVQLRRVTSLRSMERPRTPSGDPSDSWKRRIGAELSGLERPRDFLVAFIFLVVFILVAAVIAWIAFG